MVSFTMPNTPRNQRTKAFLSSRKTLLLFFGYSLDYDPSIDFENE